MARLDWYIRSNLKPRHLPMISRPIPFEALDRTHHKIIEVLGQFERLLAHLDENGADDVARWRQDNGRYLERIRTRYPRLHALIEEAADTVAGGTT